LAVEYSAEERKPSHWLPRPWRHCGGAREIVVERMPAQEACGQINGPVRCVQQHWLDVPLLSGGRKAAIRTQEAFDSGDGLGRSQFECIRRAGIGGSDPASGLD